MRRIKYIKSKDFRSEEFNNFVEEKYPQLIKEKKPEIILVSGGDGALLHAIQKYNSKNVSFFGRAAGTLNFFMNKFDDFEKQLDDLISGKEKIRTLETSAIKVELLNEEGKKIKLGDAINEVILGSTIMGYHNFLMTSEDTSFETFNFKGSGICISTDLGSTGYNFNLGGPVVPLGSTFWPIKGIVTNRYINDILPIQQIRISCLGSRSRPNVYLDGIKYQYKLNSSDTIVLSKGENIKLGFFEETDFARKRINITSRYRKG